MVEHVQRKKRIEFTPQALRVLRTFEKEQQLQILTFVAGLKQDACPPGARTLRPITNCYRYVSPMREDQDGWLMTYLNEPERVLVSYLRLHHQGRR